MSEATGAKSGAIALVTGGGTGVGRAIAKALGAQGYHVVISGRRIDVLEKAASDLASQTGEAFTQSQPMWVIRSPCANFSMRLLKSSGGSIFWSTMRAFSFQVCRLKTSHSKIGVRLLAPI